MINYNCSIKTDLFERVAYIPIFTVGLVFMVITLCIFCRIKRWTSTHIYMVNLLAADFLTITFLPFRILEAFCPINPSFLCTFLLCVHFSSMYCSIFTITAISIQRYIAIRFPLLTKTLVSKAKLPAVALCIFIWAVVIVICATNYTNLNPEHLESCYNLKINHKLQIHFFLLLEILGYLVPVLIIIFCSTQTIYVLGRSLRRVAGKDQAERKRIASLIASNMFTFIVCFTPFHIGLLLQYLSVENKYFVKRFLNATEWIATAKCCLDSVGFYFLLKRSHKKNKSSLQ